MPGATYRPGGRRCSRACMTRSANTRLGKYAMPASAAMRSSATAPSRGSICPSRTVAERTLSPIDLQMQQVAKRIDAIAPGDIDAINVMYAYARHPQEAGDAK